MPAIAQTNEPAHRAVDANGVDLLSGTYPFFLTEGTIGSGDGTIAVERHGTSAGGVGNWQNTHAYQLVSGSTISVFVVFGDRSEEFTSTSGGAFVPRQANGATLTGGNHSDFTYTSADGAVMTFGAPVTDPEGDSNLCSHQYAAQHGCYALPTGITQPNGATVSFDWDVHGNCAEEEGAEHNDCNYSWRLSGLSNSFGYAAGFDYASNTVYSHQNPSTDWYKRSGAVLSNGGTTRTVSYNFVSSTVTDVTDADGRVWRLTNGTNSFGVRRPGSSSDDISVTLSSGIVTQVVRDGITTGYSRSVSGSTATTTITDALSHTSTVVANTSIGRITSVTDPLSRQTQYQYDSNGRLTRETRPEGDYTAYTYDGRGNVTETRQVAKSGTGLSDLVTTASYASSCSTPVTCNRPNSTTDARGNTTDYTYNTTHGGVLTVTAPAVSGTRPQSRYTYALTNGEYQLTEVSACAAGSTSSPTCVGTANESRTVIGYDANGNVASVTRRDGTGALSATETMTYDGVGNLLTVDGPLSGTADTTRYRYDGARQVIGVIGPDPDAGGSLKHRAVRVSFGAQSQQKVEAGTVNSQSDGDWAAFSTLEEIQTEYDSRGRPIVRRLVSGGTTHALTQTSYDGLGRPQCTAQRMNPSEFATSSLPSDACTLDTQGSFGPDRIARTTYDNASQVILVQTGYGVSGVAADEAATTYTSNGQMATVTDAEANRTTYEYDGHDRLVKTRFPSPSTDNASSTTDYEQLTLDAAGNVTSRRLRDGTSIGYTYDALNRLTAKDLPSSPWYNLDRAYAYDNLGRLTYADGNSAFTFAYDALGRLTGETSPWGSTAYQYDLAGRRTRLTWPGSGLYVDYDHLVTGEITVIRENGATSGAGVLGTYVYDDRGRRASLTRGNGAVTSYSYDNVSRLTQLVQDPASTGYDLTLDFSYNPAGQIASSTRSNDAYAWTNHYAVNRNYTANGLNQYSAAGSVTPSYDANGNLTAAGGPTYAYTAENVLVSASGASYQEMTADSIERLFRYYDGSANRWLVYDGQSLIAEYASGGTVLRRYVHGPGVDEPLVWYEGSGTSDRRWLHADERGSVIAISNGSGTVTNVNTYDEYGIPGASNAGRFQYTGQQWLAEYGVQYSRARIYSPTLGRFTQTDPIGFDGGMNIYAYVGNDPVNLTDPSGLQQDIWVTASWTRYLQQQFALTLLRNEIRLLQRLERVENGRERGQGGDDGDKPDCDQPGADPSNCNPVVDGPGPPRQPSQRLSRYDFLLRGARPLSICAGRNVPACMIEHMERAEREERQKRQRERDRNCRLANDLVGLGGTGILVGRTVGPTPIGAGIVIGGVIVHVYGRIEQFLNGC